MSKQLSSILTDWQKLMSGQGALDPRHPDYSIVREDVKVEVSIHRAIALTRIADALTAKAKGGTE